MSKSVATLQYLETPRKAASDKKQYKHLILPNGLKLILVSDNKTGCTANDAENSSNLSSNEEANEKLSAVALIVDVGAFSQPKEYQGLAHFLEHMIFMGSKKYPKENFFDTHLNKYGGSNNAFTDCEETVYFFEVAEKQLDSSMDCFVAQIKEPLLIKESMTREREAVESEYQLTLNNDAIRRSQLIQSLANENYPHDSFTWGNLKSLKEDIESEEELHRNLQEFYERHYSAHRMYACIQSCLPLEELEELGVKHFADIHNNHLNGLDFQQYNYENAFKREFYEEVFYVKPIENVCKLDLTWVLPSTEKMFKCKPDDFLANLLGYEGSGSLCAYLRKRLWALQVMAGSETNPMFTLLTLNITLTELGFENIDNVLKSCFAYIKLFTKASLLNEIYQEISFVKRTNFNYATESTAVNNAQHLARCCKYYPATELLTGPQLYFQYIEEEVQNILNHLNQFHFNIMITTHQKCEDIVYDKKEKWFGAEYTRKKIPEKWLKLWHNSCEIKELYLPESNKYIANDFRIFWLEEGKKQLPEAPERLEKTNTFELWFRQDDKFLLPHGYMLFHLMSPLLRMEDGRNSILCSLYLDLVEHHLVEELYPASVAGINYQMYCGEKGVVLTVDGYNEKLHLVVEILIKALISYKDRITELQLEIFKKQTQKNYYNTLIKPDTVNSDLQGFMLKHKHWLLTDKYKYISNINFQDIQSFATEFTQELYVQALIQGNLQQETALKAMRTVMEHLNCKEIKQKYLLEDRGMEIPLGTHKILCYNLNLKDCNTFTSNFYQIGPRSLKQECTLSLIMMILEAPAYDTLRTKQQLGYYVSCSLQIHNNIMGYLICVSSQETKHSAFYVQQCIQAFHQNILSILEEVSLEDFANFKSALIKLKEIKDITLYEEVSRNCCEITSEEYLFQRRSKEIETLRTLEKQDVLEFWLNNATENSRSLIVQVMGAKTTEDVCLSQNIERNQNLDLVFMSTETDGSAITELEEFKQGLQVYPVVRTEI